VVETDVRDNGAARVDGQMAPQGFDLQCVRVGFCHGCGPDWRGAQQPLKVWMRWLGVVLGSWESTSAESKEVKGGCAVACQGLVVLPKRGNEGVFVW
jgi:hypothetical protein